MTTIQMINWFHLILCLFSCSYNGALYGAQCSLLFIYSFDCFHFIVQWPKGTYTLVKPKVGCPPGWKEGWRKQDNEDKNNQNFITPGHHFFGTSHVFLYHVTVLFCFTVVFLGFFYVENCAYFMRIFVLRYVIFAADKQFNV